MNELRPFSLCRFNPDFPRKAPNQKYWDPSWSRVLYSEVKFFNYDRERLACFSGNCRHVPNDAIFVLLLGRVFLRDGAVRPILINSFDIERSKHVFELGIRWVFEGDIVVIDETN